MSLKVTHSQTSTPLAPVLGGEGEGAAGRLACGSGSSLAVPDPVSHSLLQLFYELDVLAGGLESRLRDDDGGGGDYQPHVLDAEHNRVVPHQDLARLRGHQVGVQQAHVSYGNAQPELLLWTEHKRDSQRALSAQVMQKHTQWLQACQPRYGIVVSKDESLDAHSHKHVLVAHLDDCTLVGCEAVLITVVVDTEPGGFPVCKVSLLSGKPMCASRRTSMQQTVAQPGG